MQILCKSCVWSEGSKDGAVRINIVANEYLIWQSFLVLSIENDLFWQPYSCGYASFNFSVSYEALHFCVIHTATQINRYSSLMWTYLCCYGESWRWSPLWRFGSVCCGMAQLFSWQFQSIKLVGLLLLRLFRWNSSHITIGSTENNNIP